MAKRAGPLVGVIIDPPDLDAAERVLAQVRYEANLTWNEKVPQNIGKGLANMLLSIFALAGITLGVCLLAGIGFGAFRILGRKLGRTGGGDAMITLHLDGK